MSRLMSDPLLSVTLRLLRFLSGLSFVLAVLLLLFAVVGQTFGIHTSHYATPQPNDAQMPLLFLGLSPLLALYGWFLLTLGRIVGSVGAGSPFVTINADRLTRMGWIAVLLKLLVVIETAVATRSVPDMVHLLSRVAGPSIVMILVLFILARVFRQGAVMHDELEGTV